MLDRTAPLSKSHLWQAASVLFVAIISQIAHWSGLTLLLFPELGALTHCVITRPNHAWSKAPVSLAITPALTGLLGIMILRTAGAGAWQTVLIVVLSLGVIGLLRSPILPALSAGVLPLVLHVSQWSYPLSLFASCCALGTFAWIRRSREGAAPETGDGKRPLPLERRDLLRVCLYLVFLTVIATLAQVTKRPLLLFPPLAVLSFDVLVRRQSWVAGYGSLRLILLFFFCGTSGVVAIHYLGDTSLAVAAAMTGALLAQVGLALYVPPAIAVSIVPFVTSAAGITYPSEAALSVAILVAFSPLARSLTPAQENK